MGTVDKVAFVRALRRLCDNLMDLDTLDVSGMGTGYGPLGDGNDLFSLNFAVTGYGLDPQIKATLTEIATKAQGMVRVTSDDVLAAEKQGPYERTVREEPRSELPYTGRHAWEVVPPGERWNPVGLKPGLGPNGNFGMYKGWDKE